VYLPIDIIVDANNSTFILIYADYIPVYCKIYIVVLDKLNSIFIMVYRDCSYIHFGRIYWNIYHNSNLLHAALNWEKHVFLLIISINVKNVLKFDIIYQWEIFYTSHGIRIVTTICYFDDGVLNIRFNCELACDIIGGVQK
jgi:hypothetical protein